MEKFRQMNKLFTLFVATVAVLAIADIAMAQDAHQQAMDLARTENIGRGIGSGLAAGLAVIGAGLGIGWIGSRSNEAVARQPEMAGRIFINMILTAALVEGVALFAVVVGGFIL
jgi:F-type H+-transporting ATPase subunit c